MTRRSPLFLLGLPLALALSTAALAQTTNPRVVPTIPETQIEPADLATPYEFISASTSADDFIVKAAKLAETRAETAAVKTLSQQLATAHVATAAAATEAGKADKVDVASPSLDGEQQGILSKLEAMNGLEFDRAYVESQLFAHQRAIAYYRGYADEGNALAAYAEKTLPQLVEHYGMLLAAAGTLGLGDPEQKQVVQ